MTDEIKHGNTAGNGEHGSYERRDLQPSGILYFMLTLAVVTVLCLFGLKFFFAFLERHEKSGQPEVNPLVVNVPADTRHVAPGYPQNVFPNPKLEEDERGQLYDIRMNQEKILYTYGWRDENAGTVHIPIERAMELIVQRGLPVRSPAGASSTASQMGNKQLAGKRTKPEGLKK